MGVKSKTKNKKGLHYCNRVQPLMQRVVDTRTCSKQVFHFTILYLKVNLVVILSTIDFSRSAFHNHTLEEQACEK